MDGRLGAAEWSRICRSDEFAECQRRAVSHAYGFPAGPLPLYRPGVVVRRSHHAHARRRRLLSPRSPPSSPSSSSNWTCTLSRSSATAQSVFGTLPKRWIPDDLFRSWLHSLRHNPKVRRDRPPHHRHYARVTPHPCRRRRPTGTPTSRRRFRTGTTDPASHRCTHPSPEPDICPATELILASVPRQTVPTMDSAV